MSLALFNAVLAGAIEVILYDEQNQPWFKQVHDLGRVYWNYNKYRVTATSKLWG